MPIDRAAALRNAEKLIRQGKLDAAIAEYVHVVDDAPGDWTVATALGDLYLRAGQGEKAVETYSLVAAGLGSEGAPAKATAVYRKILKLKPDYEPALVQMGELLAAQQLHADARGYLTTVLEQRASRGDARGAAEMRVRLGALDPDDYPARILAARAQVELGDMPAALQDLKAVAAALAERGRWGQCIEALAEAASFAPDDGEIRERLLEVYLATGDFARARSSATTVDEFRLVAAALDARGRTEDALAVLGQAAQLHPIDRGLGAELAQTFLARGDIATAATYLTVETAGDDPVLLLTLAEIQLRGDGVDDGLGLLRRLLEGGMTPRDPVTRLACRVARERPDAGFGALDVVTSTCAGAEDWAGAAAALLQFAGEVPHHVPALMRLVEIAVDGALDATLSDAQALLADAYLQSGAATEARYVAEDLASREPWVVANIERLRRALTLCGETDPDRVVADWLSGESPFSSGDLSFDVHDASVKHDPAAAGSAEGRESMPSGVGDAEASSSVGDGAQPVPAESHELGSDTVDLTSVVLDLDAAGPGHNAREPQKAPTVAPPETDLEEVEVDLSMDLNDIVQETSAGGGSDLMDLDSVFAQMRTEVSQATAAEVANEHYKRGLALREAGDLDAAVAALQEASRAPALRFMTAALLGRIFAERGMAQEAVEWFERAASAPAPSVEEGRGLQYDFAVALEATGDRAKALALLLELRAVVKGYRDVDARVGRLNKAQARG